MLVYKIRHLFRFACSTGYDTGGIRANRKKTLPNILLSNASLVTKSCIAPFVEDDSFNLSALSDCSTGPSPPLAYAKSTLSSSTVDSRPTPAVYGPAYLAVFDRFQNKRLIAVGKFDCNVKYHLPMSSKLGFRVPRWNRNDTFCVHL